MTWNCGKHIHFSTPLWWDPILPDTSVINSHPSTFPRSTARYAGPESLIHKKSTMTCKKVVLLPSLARGTRIRSLSSDSSLAASFHLLHTWCNSPRLVFSPIRIPHFPLYLPNSPQTTRAHSSAHPRTPSAAHNPEALSIDDRSLVLTSQFLLSVYTTSPSSPNSFNIPESFVAITGFATYPHSFIFFFSLFSSNNPYLLSVPYPSSLFCPSTLLIPHCSLSLLLLWQVRANPPGYKR